MTAHFSSADAMQVKTSAYLSRSVLIIVSFAAGGGGNITASLIGHWSNVSRRKPSVHVYRGRAGSAIGSLVRFFEGAGL
jgi:hypothetical protein